jgi:hypothetical protein
MSHLSFLSICASVIIFVACGGNSNQNSISSESSESEASALDVETGKTTITVEPAELRPDSYVNFETNDGGSISFTFKEINTRKLNNGTYNLVMKVQIKNNTDSDFFILDSGWKLTDTDMIEVEESGVWNPTWGDFGFATFFMECVEAGYGSIAEVGYHVKPGEYYLNIFRRKVGKITIQ